MQPYIQPFTTRYYELGQDHRLRVQALCNYMEEAAGLHADSLGVGLERLMAQGLTWVLAKMRLEVRELPGGGASFFLAAWPRPPAFRRVGGETGDQVRAGKQQVLDVLRHIVGHDQGEQDISHVVSPGWRLSVRDRSGGTGWAVLYRAACGLSRPSI